VTRFPGWIAASFGVAGRFEAIRRSTLANLFGSYFCLIQDDILDRENADRPELLLVSNYFFHRCTSEYQELFDSSSPFWALYDRYWLEYWESLAWEKSLREVMIKAADQPDITPLGKKLSPLKISAACMSLASGQHQKLRTVETMIEHFHTGVQALDDVNDWESDLRRGQGSYFLSLVERRIESKLSSCAARGERAELMREAVCDCVKTEYLSLGAEHLRSARSISVSLDCIPFTRLIEGLLCRIELAGEIADDPEREYRRMRNE
jgi:hypothetical protein